MEQDNQFEFDYNDPPSFTMVGKNGSGKSTLVNAIFGRNVAETGKISDVTKSIKKYYLEESGVEIVDTPGAGGLDLSAEDIMRKHLNLQINDEHINIDTDVLIFVFNHHRLDRHEIDFFNEVKKCYNEKLIVVKNYSTEESEDEIYENREAIRTKTGRIPICVNAKTTENLDRLIEEIFTYLPANKINRFNKSLLKKKENARYLSKLHTLKIASQVAIIRSSDDEQVKNNFMKYKKELVILIQNAYISNIDEDALFDDVQCRKKYSISEDRSIERSIGGVLLGGFGALIGWIGGPIGLGIGSALGTFFGAAIIPSVSRGGTPAVANIIGQGYGLTKIIEDSFENPLVLIGQSEEQIKNWVESNSTYIKGTLEESYTKANFALKKAGLNEFLNHPNTKNPIEIEMRLQKVVDYVFEEI